VSVASRAHQRGNVRLDDLNFEQEGSYTPWAGYGQAKTANIWFANELERRFGSQHLHATSIMPGAIGTSLQRHVDEATKKHFESPQMQALPRWWAREATDTTRDGEL